MAPNDLLTVIALRHLGCEREVVVLKVKGEDFYVFLPRGLSGLGPYEIHYTLHKSGEQHMRVKEFLESEGKWKLTEIGAKAEAQLQPPAELRGACRLGRSGIFGGHFPDLRPVGTNDGELIMLDAEAAHFRDVYTVVGAYVVEPGCEDAVVADPYCEGPRIVHFERRCTPWMAVELFQSSRASVGSLV